MPNYQKFIIAGHLTRDIETRVASTGTTIANFGIATTRRAGKDGSGKDETLFIDCTAFGKSAEILAQFVKKGSALLADGRLVLDQWEDKTTHEKKSKIKMVVENFQFLGEKAKVEPKSESDDSPF